MSDSTKPGSFATMRLAPPSTPPLSSGKDAMIEGLRGLAALTVVLEHTLHLLPDRGALHLARGLCNGRAAVLIFFTLSGYVIGRSNARPWSETSRADYWRRRLERLAPLYLLAVLFTYAATRWLGVPHASLALPAHLLCLENHETYFGLSLPPFVLNQPFWTLNAEIVFYSLFLLVWRTTPTVWSAFGVVTLAVLLAPACPPGMDFLGS